MPKFRIYERLRKPAPNPNKILRLNRAEYGSTFKKKGYDFDNFYPNIDPLYQAVSKFYKISKNKIIVGLGAESLIKDVLLFAYFSGIRKVLTNTNNFFMYKYYSRLFGIKFSELLINPLENKFRENDLIKKIKKDKIGLLVIVNPSHPFEKYWKIGNLKKIINYCKRNNVIVLVDEVYLSNSKDTSLKLINKFDNLIVIKSLSKMPGLPGLRVGFLFANTKLIGFLNSLRLAIELPENSIRKAVKYFTFPSKYLYPNIRKINEAREYAKKEFGKRKIKSYGNYGNSVSALFKDSKEVFKVGNFLKKNKVLINFTFQKPLDRFINLTTTNKKNVKFFFRILDKLYK